MKAGLHVGDAMTRRPVTVPPEATLCDVAELMEHKHIGSVLVQAGGELLGIVTETDFVRRAILLGYNVYTTPIRMIMTTELVTVSPTMDLFDAIILMKDGDIKHLPVVDNGGLIGFVTAKDMLRLEPGLFETIVDSLTMHGEHRPQRRSTVMDIEEFEKLL